MNDPDLILEYPARMCCTLDDLLELKRALAAVPRLQWKQIDGEIRIYGTPAEIKEAVDAACSATS